MPYTFYKLVHFSGLILLFLAWGALLRAPRENGFGKEEGLNRKFLMACHGIGLLLLLVGGFGMIARIGLLWPWPGWLWGKLLIWLALGGSVVGLKRRPEAKKFFWWLIFVFGALAAYLVIFKPF